MDKGVVSEKLLEIIGGREVLASVFTAYTFEPDFFELEVVPLLLKTNAPYSTDDRIKCFMVRENLRESGLLIDVFYDLPMFRREGKSSPEMEYLCHGVHLGNHAFHGKVNMILVKDAESEEQSLLVTAGSNNLTRAGWWDNIECQHWEEVISGEAQRKFINLLKEDVAFLKGHQAIQGGSIGSAIDLVESFLSSCRGSNTADEVFYFGLSYKQNRAKFINFLANSLGSTPFRNWNLEIISPFFADDPKNKSHLEFQKLGVESTKILLPKDEYDKALCDEVYFGHISDEPSVEWAQWDAPLAKELGAGKGMSPFRRLHAKIYHFYNGRQSWVFVGSVNFTHKAMHENVEAGFLVRMKGITPLLQSMSVSEDISFAELQDLVPGMEDNKEEDIALPEIHLRYDWVTEKLMGRAASGECKVVIVGAEGEPVISPWAITPEVSTYIGKASGLRAILKNGSLVKLRDASDDKEKRFSDHWVLLQQLGWSHKPLDLPSLSAEQILAIYAGMSLERRQMMLLNAKVRALVLAKQAGELTSASDSQVMEQFFCEYAEIFNAFSKLKQKLERTLEAEQFKQLDYYLTGMGVDSLPSLIKRSQETDGEKTLRAVTTYILLLSALEIYRNAKFKSRTNVEKVKRQLERSINAFKKGEHLKLENETNRVAFFKWFEKEFFRVYKVSRQAEQQ